MVDGEGAVLVAGTAKRRLMTGLFSPAFLGFSLVLNQPLQQQLIKPFSPTLVLLLVRRSRDGRRSVESLHRRRRLCGWW
jgi:hypothetical protein